ncbi:DUF302 domain-containing protein [Bradyrhizobium sp. Leo121]|uniref:DUF302 domain-containing protein n=1 Tax=Bradyrhizobium sp. Leo121 TaxID=1571195 RepID=UPI0013EEECB5|nr:DUF302 domain-containing protein [Bradyrhizobium sp. Leo121]
MIVVDYLDNGKRHEPFQRLRTTSLAFDDVLEGLRLAIEAADILVLHEIDAQAVVQRSNYQIGPTRQILFFHPRFMARLLAADPSALLEVPLKFSVIAGSGGQVFVRWQDPECHFARYQNAELSQLGRELSATCERIAGAVS